MRRPADRKNSLSSSASIGRTTFHRFYQGSHRIGLSVSTRLLSSNSKNGTFLAPGWTAKFEFFGPHGFGLASGPNKPG